MRLGLASLLFLALVSLVSAKPFVRMGFLRKFSTVDDVPDSYFQNNRYIYGYVERVIDGDTIRIRHRPGFGLRRHSTSPLQQRGISKDTLSIRIYGVDCPEIAKNKNQVTQPFGLEAQEYTTKLVLHKMVRVKFLSRDQYRRAVAVVETVPPRLVPFRRKDLSVELARRGLAELYTGGGAQYYDNREKLEKLIHRAQRKRKGQWSIPESERVSAAEQKRRQKEALGSSRRSSVSGTKARLSKGFSNRGGAIRVDKASTGNKKKKHEQDTILDLAITGLDFIP